MEEAAPLHEDKRLINNKKRQKKEKRKKKTKQKRRRLGEELERGIEVRNKDG
jgi:hypothetical protein